MYLINLISLKEARIVGEAALAKAMENPESPMAIAVVDRMGDLVYYVKMDGTSPIPPKMSINKAYSALQFPMDTADIEKFLKEDNKDIRDFVDPRLTSIPGGVCLRAPDGSVIGAIGTSGRAPNRDKVTDLDVALAGARALPK